jgi:MFS family permease
VVGPLIEQELQADAARLGVLTSLFFLTFALMQLPVGLLLDRYGARTVQLGLLPFLAAGALITAFAHTFTAMALGRALIGIGVSACLMAAFKAVSETFPRQRLALLNGAVLGVGSLGAVAAGAPLQWLLQITDWRSVFALLAGAAAALVPWLLLAPSGAAPPPEATRGGIAKGYGAIARSGLFLRIFPLYTATHGVFLAYQGLWVAPWLESVNGVGHQTSAGYVSLLAVMMACGYLISGTLADRLGRAGVGLATMAGWGMASFIVVQCAIAAKLPLPLALLWSCYGVLGGIGVVSYALLAQSLPAASIGRANALLNLAVFLAAFAFQSGIGVLVDVLQYSPLRPAELSAHQLVMLLLIALEALALLWYIAAPRLLRSR